MNIIEYYIFQLYFTLIVILYGYIGRLCKHYLNNISRINCHWGDNAVNPGWNKILYKVNDNMHCKSIFTFLNQTTSKNYRYSCCWTMFFQSNPKTKKCLGTCTLSSDKWKICKRLMRIQRKRRKSEKPHTKWS